MAESQLCKLCRKRRTSAKSPSLERSLHAALQTCCHLWIPAADDPICTQCKNFYAEHLRKHDGTATTCDWRKRPSIIATGKKLDA